MIDQDPPEHVGRDITAPLADPPKSNKGKSAAPVVNSSPPQGSTASADPGTPKAVYHPPAPGQSHPQHARKSVAERLDAAEISLNLANLELTQATQHLRAAENAEADALDALTKVLPGPSAEEVNRQRLRALQDEKLRRVEAGESPVPAPVKTHSKSPIDTFAAHRARAVPHAANAPLRSPVVRRSV